MTKIDYKVVLALLIKHHFKEIPLLNGQEVTAFDTSPKVDNEIGVNLLDVDTGKERLFNIKVTDCT